MRVIAGKYGSRKLKSLKGSNTRPTTDKIKEGIFNMLGGYFTSNLCLDFYGGSGALAIEAVSRGVDHAVIIEQHRPAVKVIEENITMTKETDRFTLLIGDNRQALKQFKNEHNSAKFDLVFLDPPYAKQRLISDIEWLESQGYLDQNAIIICESDKELQLPDLISDFKKSKEKSYGVSRIMIYERRATNEWAT